ncbi:hydantoinase B/oxoprolinase family protein [Sinorhizobium meliloti]|uniref:hydantoinase B/oxoprolinase family protein n=1 Tax=Rhizobium meliloti TaxID=382 RepID=UPI0004152CA7|nr:hydantoinase B/oxoprolinase family protein [Sinorhizobium meliloti]ARS71027.1 methylhydantoinase [Sinorhizobium meliloti RU11/001]
MRAVRTMVMNNRFKAIVEEASACVYRTAHTTFVKMVQDYQCAVATADGDMFAFPSQSGVKQFIGTPMAATIDKIGKENFKPGDIYVTNDPFTTEGLLTHLMDITMIRPIFYKDELIAFGWAFIHSTDIGGAVAGSISPAFTEVFQEGIRVRPMRLFIDDKMNEDVLGLYTDNSRTPKEIAGDLEAMISAMKSIDRRLSGLCDRYGVEEVKAGMQDVISYSEEKARSVLANIPDGEYKFSDYLEMAGEGNLVHVCVKLIVKNGEIEVDFTGTDPQIPAAHNLTTGSRAHPYIVQALITFVLTHEPLTPWNAGIIRSIKGSAPSGCLINAVHPAAGGSRAASGCRVYDAMIGCLNQALDGGVASSGSGSGIIVFSGPDPRTGANRVTVVNPVPGGSGGRNGADGVDAIEPRNAALLNVPVEITEAETMLVVRAYRSLPDSRAAGQWNGGAAQVIELENRGEAGTITCRNLNRFHFQPWGMYGGEAGRIGFTKVNPGQPNERSDGKITVLHLGKGELLQITSPSGGGFGDPLKRSLDMIEADVRTEMVSRERAKAVYGAVFNADGGLDRNATEANRRKLMKDVPYITYGKNRDDHDRVWPYEVRRELAMRAMKLDMRLRWPVVDRVQRKMLAIGKEVTPAILHEAIEAEVAALGGSMSKARH